MLERIGDVTGLAELNELAGWFIGSALVALVAGVAGGSVFWAAGRVGRSTHSSQKGLQAVVLTVVGAMLLGSIGGAIQWSTTSGRTEGLLPTAAKQRTIKIDRDSPTTACASRVAVQAEKHRGAGPSTNDYTLEFEPSDDEHAALNEIVTELGGFDMTAGGAYSRSLWWERNGNSVGSGAWGNYVDHVDGKKQWRLSSVRWLPDASAGDCAVDNREAASGAPIEIVIHERYRKARTSLFDWPETGRYIIFDLDVPTD